MHAVQVTLLPNSLYKDKERRICEGSQSLPIHGLEKLFLPIIFYSYGYWIGRGKKILVAPLQKNSFFLGPVANGR